MKAQDIILSVLMLAVIVGAFILVAHNLKNTMGDGIAYNDTIKRFSIVKVRRESDINFNKKGVILFLSIIVLITFFFWVFNTLKIGEKMARENKIRRRHDL